MSVNTPRAPEAPSLSDVHKLIAPTYSAELTEVKTDEANTRWFDDFMKTPSGKSARTRLQRSKSSYARALSLLHIYSTVFHAVTKSIPGMQHGYNFTAEQLCGADVWLHWKGNAVAGMCMAHLVNIKAIPLVPHCTPSGKGSCKYRLPPADGQSAQGAHGACNPMNFIEILTIAPAFCGARSGAPLVHQSINQHNHGA
jgi:hypothetical protein